MALFRRREEERVPFDPERQYAVIRCSICTGEKAAGFRDRESGRFVEVMLIRTREDEETFKRLYGLDAVAREY